MAAGVSSEVTGIQGPTLDQNPSLMAPTPCLSMSSFLSLCLSPFIGLPTNAGML